jgi:putative SOS response-associated peptidase YedK
LEEEQPIAVRELDPAAHLALKHNQLTSERGIVSLKPADRPERRNQQPQKEEEQRDHRGRRYVIPSSDQTDEVFGIHRKAIKGQKAKQPYAIAMKDGAPFGIAGIWENWKEPASGEWIRTFAIITTDSNELVADIHDRMPVILTPADYARWLGEEPDPRDLMRPFPADLLRMWPISTRVNKPENDDPAIIEPIATDRAEYVASRGLLRA